MKTAKRILVVDDEKTILLSLAYALKADGVEVITCNKAEWAEKALQNYYFDIVITDTQTDLLELRRAVYDLELVWPSGDVLRLMQGKVIISLNVTE